MRGEKNDNNNTRSVKIDPNHLSMSPLFQTRYAKKGLKKKKSFPRVCLHFRRFGKRDEKKKNVGFC